MSSELLRTTPCRTNRPNRDADGNRRFIRWLTRTPAVLLIVLCVGCNLPASDEVTLLWYCGAGIRPPAAELAETFGRLHGVAIECDYAGSEVLLSRAKLTGSGDLYMPGDVYYVEQADQDGLVARSQTACYFIPVILVQKGNPKDIQSLSDLVRPGVTVGLGDAKACAIGRQCAKLFAKNDISEEQISENVVFRSLTVNELGDKVKLGSLDAVIVWDGVAAYFADNTDVVAIPREKNVISTVAVATLKSSEHPELANQFLDFVASDEGKAIFEKHHYSLTLPD